MSRVGRSTGCVFVTILISFLLSSLVDGSEGEPDIFKLGDEIKVSSEEMNCNYQLEDYAKHGYNFAYPKLILIEDNNPLIAYIDVNSSRLLFADVSTLAPRIICSIAQADGQNWRKWPIIITKKDALFLAHLPGPWANKNIQIRMQLLKKDGTLLDIQGGETFSIDQHCSLSDIHPCLDTFILFGNCDFFCWRYFPYIFSNLPTFRHNAAFLLDEGKILERRSIEEEGCFSAYKSEYEVSESGTIYAAWLRDTRTVNPKCDEMIYFSSSKDALKWGKPISIYLAKDAKMFLQLNNLSLTSGKDSAFLLWQDFEKGIFFGEIKGGDRVDITKISDTRKTTDVGWEPLEFSSTIKIASDTNGNAYSLWTEHFDGGYRLLLKTRINGRWMNEFAVSEGRGYLKLPDMKIDKKGNIHITYIRSINPDKPREEYGCFYMMIRGINTR